MWRNGMGELATAISILAIIIIGFYIIAVTEMNK